MSETRPFQAVLPAVVLLLALVGLTAWLAVASGAPESEPACGPLSALPVQPLGVEYPAFRLEAFGRSSVNLAPGDTLCLALGWENGAGSVDNYALVIDVQNGSDSRIGSYQGPLAGPEGWEPFFRPVEYYALSIDPGASPGQYDLVVSVLLDGEALRAPLAIGVVQIVEDGESDLPGIGGDVEFEGEPVYPFIPTKIPDEEDV